MSGDSAWIDGPGKRAFDLLAAGLGLIVLLVVGPFVVLAIRLDSPGPAMLRQARCGRGGKPFLMFKFRSMHWSSKPPASPWTARNDPRITRVGKILRALHLDELPQVLNVIRGDMSLVGPRPEQVAVADRLRREIPDYAERERGRPGMISSALLHQGYVDSIDGTRQKLAHDLQYLAASGFRTDLLLVMAALVHSARLRGR